MSENSGHAAVADDELSPLERDLLLLDRISANPAMDERTKLGASRHAGIIRHCLAETAYFSRVGKELGVDQLCHEFTDEEVADLLALSENQENPLRALLREHFLSPNIDCLGQLATDDFEGLLTFTYRLFLNALWSEYLLRRNSRERALGREVRETIVEERESERGKRLDSLASRVIGPLPGRVSLPPLAFPQAAAEESFSFSAKEEAHSIAAEALFGKTAEFMSVSRPAANPAFIQASMNGTLDKIFFQARGQVANKIKRELRHQVLLVEGDAPLPRRGEESSAGKTLFEIFSSKENEHDVLERKILFEEILTSRVLTVDEKKVLVSIYAQGRTEEETSSIMGISQGEVSKTKKSCIEKIKSFISTSPTAASNSDGLT